ncbi:hypothetical protein [Methylorubrum sp. SL192]|uniref:hypothetical protein n=1 Tax=Methylorubrum sp. SL192 TaxID=2995167 RepID=UPI002275AA34|nr:hypothetical protein [Methylorubrum sp. SL192]MCY1644939.1 hypothetical protein [Methylorubrum sp. SL192]
MPFAVSLALTLPLQPAPAPLCPRADTAVMAALVGDVRREPAATDPAFEAAIRAIRAPQPQKAAPRRKHRR